MAVFTLVERTADIKDILNRRILRDAGAGPGERIRWTTYDGDTVDRRTGEVTSTGDHTLWIENQAGFHIKVTASGGGPEIFNLQDSGLDINDLHVTGPLQVDGNATLGNSDSDTHTIVGVTTYRNAANTTIQMRVDSANNKVIFGNGGAAISGASNDFFTVVGRAYFAPSTAGQAAIYILRGTGGNPGWNLKVTADSNGDLVFSDDGDAERFRIGDTSSTYAALATGNARTTGVHHIGNGLVVGGTSFAGSEITRLIGLTRVEGQLVVSTGGANITGTVVTSSYITPGALSGTPVANSLYQQLIVKAWAVIQPNGTIDGSANMAAIVDVGTGDWVFQWDRDFTNTNFSALAIAQTNNAYYTHLMDTSLLAGQVRVNVRDAAGAVQDPTRIHMMAIGVQ